MKLFIEKINTLSSQSRFKYKGNYTFRVLNEYSKENETSSSSFSNQNHDSTNEFNNCYGKTSQTQKSSNMIISSSRCIENPNISNNLINDNNLNLTDDPIIDIEIGFVDKDPNYLTDNYCSAVNSSYALLNGLNNANIKSSSNDAFGFTIEPFSLNNFGMSSNNFATNLNRKKNVLNSSFYQINFYDKNEKINMKGNNFNSNFNNKKKTKYLKLGFKSLKHKKNNYNIGRWTEDEHRRFIEAILKYGNEWKSVQKHIKTRSSTQSRSHSQKFFLKIKNYDLFDFKDRKPCISSLNELAKNLDEKERENMLELLISYEYHDGSDKKENVNSKCSSGESNASVDNECNERMLNKKRKNNSNNFSYSSSNVDYDFEEDNISIINAGISAYSSNYSKISSATTAKTKNLNLNFKNSIFKGNQDDIIDEFNDQFSKTFVNSRLRRNSFEDNIFLLYADTVLLDKGFSGRRRSVSKNKKEEQSRKNSILNRNSNEDAIVDAFIDLNSGFIMV